jgi:beta-glucanase (GH16 family)
MTIVVRRAGVARTAVGLLAVVVGGCASGSTADVSAEASRVVSAVASPVPTLAEPTGATWGLTFQDEFDTDALAAHWNTCYWWQVDGGCTIASNDELEWYRPEAVSVSDGWLRLTAEAVEQTTTDGRSLPYRSGVVTTGRSESDLELDNAYAFTYGFVEAAVELPTADGTWPSFWLLSADNTSLPEIDVFEWYGSTPDRVTMHVHQRAGDGDGDVVQGHEATMDDARGRRHVFGVLWTPTEVTFYLDGRATGTIDDPALVPTTPMYLILNLAIGGPDEVGTPRPEQFPTAFSVDYVRVWQAA